MKTQEMLALTGNGELDAEHLACPCTPGLSVCGVELDPADFDVDGEWMEGEVCVLCEIVVDAGTPCPGCGE